MVALNKAWKILFGILVAITLISGIVLANVSTSNQLKAGIIVRPSSLHFDYIVTIILENKSLNESYDCGTSCAFITQLANTQALALNYTGLTHPSMANYIALTSADTYSTSDGQGPGSVNAVNIVDRLETVGLTWKAYLENYDGACSDSGGPDYGDNHNPFVKYADIYNNPERCARIVNAGNDANNSSGPFLTDLSSLYAPNYMWLSPSKCNDMHSCPVSTGDTYLANLVPKILSSYIFRIKRAALFITFDEGHGTFPNDQVAAIWAGPTIKQAYRSASHYDHYSYIRTIEDNWSLSTLTSNDANVAPMSEFFVRSV